jgi:hypothetical protein
LFVGDSSGHLKLISLADGTTIKDFGQIQSDGFGLTGVVITIDGKFFFGATGGGELRQWNYQDLNLVRD